ncbi:hypothetical protein EAF04_003020 [Stromatinia cepivora]|nr:hypothetical protein EAF04_003020 [Stromatinia cepivora]
MLSTASRNTMLGLGPTPKPSSFALRYYDFADGHSDLTPRPSTFPSFPPPQSSPRDWDTIEAHQKNRLHSFTTRELLNLDAISERPMAASTLATLPILSLLRRNQWDSTGKMFGRKEAIRIDDWGQSGDGEDGKYGEWVSGNEHVWNALRPSLAIASQYLLSSHMLPWFDALLLATRVPVAPHRNLLDVPDLQSFTFRPSPYSRQETIEARERILTDCLLKDYDILFSFFEPGKNPYTGEIDPDIDESIYPDRNTLAFAHLRWNQRHPTDPKEQPRYNIVLMLNVNYVTPLVVDKYLNHAERYAISWRMAVVIVHELIHAMELIRNHPNRNVKMTTPSVPSEPYFEDEALAELGYSYENAVVTPWPTMEMILTYTTSIENPQLDGEPQPPDYKYLHPIPVTVYEDVQSASFWEHAVRPYGQKILYYRTMKASVGIKVQDEYVWGRDDITGRVHVSPLRNETKSFVDDMERLKNVTNRTPDEKQIFQIGDKLIKSAEHGAAFWSDSIVQRQNINEYITMIKDNEINNVKDENYRLQIFNVLMKATEKHIALMQNQLRLDRLNQNISTDRRIDLLKFNRGMRALIQKLKLAWKTELSHPAIHFSTILNHLELAMMYLFVPDTTTGLIDTEDRKEINVISQARIEYISGHIDNCQEMIAWIGQNEGQSSYVLTCTGLMKLACGFRSLERVWNNVDYDMARQCFARIRYLTRLYDGGERVWIELLGNWIRFARDLVNNLDPGGRYGIWELRMKVIEKKRKFERDIGEEAPPYLG